MDKLLLKLRVVPPTSVKTHHWLINYLTLTQSVMCMPGNSMSLFEKAVLFSQFDGNLCPATHNVINADKCPTLRPRGTRPLKKTHLRLNKESGVGPYHCTLTTRYTLSNPITLLTWMSAKYHVTRPWGDGGRERG